MGLGDQFKRVYFLKILRRRVMRLSSAAIKSRKGISFPFNRWAILVKAKPGREGVSSRTKGSPLLVEIIIRSSSGTIPNRGTTNKSKISSTPII
ncbi:unknown [Crocosphaera subtropica ATCC 51142]|uniref:Uncharacterized protein n=1 Tax=Crocosphaera subtropica (strain ATCC 51142 / BH68) TaxID=43989 RepID=B1WRH3_CROS5|nr:unknown [Crocosphaera subtropica ATCC 51142]